MKQEVDEMKILRWKFWDEKKKSNMGWFRIDVIEMETLNI